MQPSSYAPPSSAQLASAPPPNRSLSQLSALPTRPFTNTLPPSQSYAVLAKVVLVQRSKHQFLLIGLVAYTALLLGVFDPKELPGKHTRPFKGALAAGFLPACLYAPLAFLGAIPLFVLRKATLTTALPTWPSRVAQLAELRERTTLRVFATYALSAIPSLAAYILCASAVSDDPRLGLFFYSKGRDAQQLNERAIFLALLHLFLAAYAAGSHVLQNRSRVEFDSAPSLSIPQRLAAKATSRIPLAVHSVLVSNALFWLSYVLLRRPVLRFLVANVVGLWARPYLYSMMRYNAAYSITLGVRALASSFVTVAVWEMTHVCFEVYATQPMNVSQFALNPNQCLLSGLRSPDPFYQHFAYLELSTLTLTNPSRRQAIFVDLKPDAGRGSGSAWHDISRECLVLIGTELQRAKGLGKLALNTPPASVPGGGSYEPHKPTSTTSNANGSPVKTENVFRPTRKSFFDSLSSSSTAPARSAGSASSNPSAVSSALAITQTGAGGLASRVPSIFQTASGAIVTPTAEPMAEGGKGAKQVENASAGNWVPQAWRGRWFGMLFGARPGYTVGKCVPREREVVWAVESLSNLLCASLVEDPYGVAQRDIPRILEALVLYLSALEGCEKTLVASDGGEEMAREVEGRVRPVQEAVKDSIRAVLDEFSPYLTEFRFPPRIANRLQLLVDWG